MDDLRHPSAHFSSDNIPDTLPILPIVDTNLFPKMVLPLVLIQHEAVELIDEAMAGNRMLGLLLSKRSDVDSRHTADDLHRIGTVAIILKMSKMEDDKAQLLIQGISRFRGCPVFTWEPLHAGQNQCSGEQKYRTEQRKPGPDGQYWSNSMKKLSIFLRACRLKWVS